MTVPMPGRGPAGFLRRVLEKLFGSAPQEEEPMPITPMHLRSMQAAVPLMNEAERRIAEHITYLASKGALDEGSGHVLDDMITSWVRLWADNADGQYQLRLHEARARVGREELTIGRYDEQVRLLDAELASLDEELEALMPAQRTAAKTSGQDPPEEPEPPSHTKPLPSPQDPPPPPDPAQAAQTPPGEPPEPPAPSVTKPYDQEHQPPREPS